MQVAYGRHSDTGSDPRGQGPTHTPSRLVDNSQMTTTLNLPVVSTNLALQFHNFLQLPSPLQSIVDMVSVNDNATAGTGVSDTSVAPTGSTSTKQDDEMPLDASPKSPAGNESGPVILHGE